MLSARHKISALKHGSLTKSEVTRYMDRFQNPEDIDQDEVESDMGITFYSM